MSATDRPFPGAVSTGKLDSEALTHKVRPILNYVSNDIELAGLKACFEPRRVVGGGQGMRVDERKAGSK